MHWALPLQVEFDSRQHNSVPPVAGCFIHRGAAHSCLGRRANCGGVKTGCEPRTAFRMRHVRQSVVAWSCQRGRTQEWSWWSRARQPSYASCTQSKRRVRYDEGTTSAAASQAASLHDGKSRWNGQSQDGAAVEEKRISVEPAKVVLWVMLTSGRIEGVFAAEEERAGRPERASFRVRRRRVHAGPRIVLAKRQPRFRPLPSSCTASQACHVRSLPTGVCHRPRVWPVRSREHVRLGWGWTRRSILTLPRLDRQARLDA